MDAKIIRIRKGDDFHCHLRQGDILKKVLPFTTRHFSRAVAMPNTLPAIVTGDDAVRYREEIMAACDNGFRPIMSIMLTKNTTPQIIREAAAKGVTVLKYIPKGVSTNSDESVSLEDLPDFYPVLQAVQEYRMVFSGHWESLYDTDGDELPEIKREEAAIPFLKRLVRQFSGLKIVVEHASTYRMIEYVKQCPANVAATLTIHHAILSYDDVCNESGEVYSPHHYCKPIAKSYFDKRAVIAAMVSGNPKFFFGSDSAPHIASAKQKKQPAAGIFSKPVALSLLARMFQGCGTREGLENFYSKFGADHYGLPYNKDTISLVPEEWTVPQDYNGFVPLLAGMTLHWKVVD